MCEQAPNSPIDTLMRDFLRWVQLTPRTHADVMDAWRSSCPRLTIWEDALTAGFVELDGSVRPARVFVTAEGQARLESSRAR